jgi:hypothetical protein
MWDFKSARHEGQDPENHIAICTVDKAPYVGMQLDVYESPATNLYESKITFYMHEDSRRNGAGRLSARRRERATARQSLHVERPRLRAAMLLQARAVSRSTFSRSERLREYRHTRSKCVASQRLRSGLMKATLASPASRLQRNTLQSERNQRGRRGGAA